MKVGMCSRLLLPSTLAVLLLAPAVAFAGPTLYVCTPTAQVLQVDGATGATSVLYSGSDAFHAACLVQTAMCTDLDANEDD